MAEPTSPLPPVVGEVFFLTSPFIERGYRTSAEDRLTHFQRGSVSAMKVKRFLSLATCAHIAGGSPLQQAAAHEQQTLSEVPCRGVATCVFLLGQFPENKQLDTRPYGGCSLGLSFAEVGSLGSI